MVHHPGEELHRDVLERQHRPMEQLEQEIAQFDLDKGATAAWRKVASA